MDSSENIKGVRATPDRQAPPTSFAGTVTGVKSESGKQTLEVQYSQGKLKFQAEGDFQVGEKVKLSFPGNGSVQVEKGAPQDPHGEGDWKGVGYTLPQNMNALKDLRAFEEQVVRWMNGKQQPGDPQGGPDKAALSRLNLPQLLLQAMAAKGGKEFVGNALEGLDPEVMSALMDALEENSGDPAAKALLSDLLRGAGRGPAQQAGGRQAVASGAFLAAEAGTGHAPWFGRIVDRREADGILMSANRMGYAGAGKSDSLFRYTMDMGGSTLEVFSSQAKQPGEFTDFELERQGGRMQARFSDPAASLPAGLRTSMGAASAEVRQGMLMASHYLQEFQSEPYYGDLVEDFGTVLAQSGLMNASGPGQPPAIPKQEQTDNLLKLFVSFPRDTEQPAAQSKAWGDAVRDPQAMLKLLQTVKPDQDASLLRADTSLRLAAQGRIPDAAGALLNAAAEAGESPEATAAWLRKLLPEAFKPEDLLKLAKDGTPLNPAGKEHEAAKFMLQAVANSLPQNIPIPEGQPTQFYYYQGQEWRNLQVTWKQDGGGKEGRKGGPKGPLQVKVETQSKHMGRVNVGVAWEPKGARLDFKNQHHDVRELLSQSLPELEKSLALLDFRVTAWTYELLPNDVPALPDPGWTRPASMSDGAHLDLRG